MLNQLARYLFEPSDQITNDGERRAARIISVICLVAFFLRLVDSTLALLVVPLAEISWGIFLLTPLVFAFYILSRTKYVRFAADGLVWSFVGFIILFFVTPETRQPQTLFYLLLPVTLAALLQSVRRTFIVWIVVFISSMVLRRLYMADPSIDTYQVSGLLFVIGIPILAATSARQRDRKLIEKQTRELEEQTRELEEQKLVLEDTNQILEKTVVGQSTRLRQSSAELVREKQLHNETERELHRKQRLEGIGLLASGIAHDFNNLLTGIGGQIAIAAHKLDPEDPAQKHIRKAATQVTRTSTVTRQLLAYASNSQDAMVELDFRSLVVDMTSFLERVIDRDVKLVHDICLDSGQPLTVLGDMAQLQQVAMNLVVNAADAITDEGASSSSDGTVMISLSNHELTPSDPLLADMLNRDDVTPGKHIKLMVQDSGCGMDVETIDKIFDPFFTTKQTGHGLGLSAVMGILRRHNAGLIVNSEVGRGTTFQVYIPACVSVSSDEILTPESNLQTERPRRADQLHILLIDDDIAVQEATAELMELQGHTVEVAANGHLGMALFEASSKSFDLVWLDLDMPLMGGVPTFHALREQTPIIPVVINSGNSTVEVSSMFVSEPATVFLPKPYTNEQMLDAIEGALH